MDILSELLALKGLLFSTRTKAKDNAQEISELSAQTGTTISKLTVNGTVTSGTTTTLTDSTQDWGADALLGKVVKIVRGENSYIREITGNTPDTMTFDALVASVNATATIGSGEGAEGQIVLTCIGDLAGAAGNDVSVVIVHGDTNTGEKHAAFANNVLTFTIDTNGMGEQQTFAAGGVDLILAADGLDDKFSVDENFTAGNLPIGGSAIDFTGGDDGVSPVSGNAYSLLYALDQDTIDAINASISELVDYVTVAGSGTGDDTYACDVGGAKSKNFAFSIADTDAKTVTLSNVPAGRCEAFMEITTTAAASVTWTLNSGSSLAWSGGSAPTLASGKVYRILLLTSDGGTTWHGFASAGVAHE